MMKETTDEIIQLAKDALKYQELEYTESARDVLRIIMSVINTYLEGDN